MRFYLQLDVIGKRRISFGESYRSIKGQKLNMFTTGGGHAKLSRRQGTDLWFDMVYKLVPFLYVLGAWLQVPAVNICV